MSAVTNELAIATTERMVLAPARYVLLPVAHLLTGSTVKPWSERSSAATGRRAKCGGMRRMATS